MTVPACRCLFDHPGPELHRPGCKRAVALHLSVGRKVPERHVVAVGESPDEEPTA